MKRIVVYTTDPCPYCRNVKQLLQSRGLDFTEVNLGRDHDGRRELAQMTGMMTFPQVVIDGQLVGGFDHTLDAARSGRLDELLAA